jgi:hypothetical protein
MLHYEWCKSCQINFLIENFINWTSGNKIIDKCIQKKQLKINNHSDILFEWIPYNQFSEIKKTYECDFFTIYSAKWKDGPLYWHYDNREYTRLSNKSVILKCLCNLQKIDFLNEV